MTYTRHIISLIKENITNRQEAVVLTGPRQAGKTKLLTTLFPEASYFPCDDEPVKLMLNSHSIATYRQYLPQSGIVIVDEVQNLTDPGRVGKLIVDNLKGIKLFITGSSGLAIKNKHTESMAGRAISYELLPLTLSEYLTQHQITGEILNFRIFDQFNSSSVPKNKSHLYDSSSLWNRVLVFGLYPALLGDPDPSLYLKNLINRIIFKDLMDLKLIDDKTKAIQLLTLLAHQIGQIISMAELANQANMDQRTVSRYIKLFQECYLIYLLYPFSKRERDVLIKRPKVYFYDTGLRNALIGNHQNLELRTDAGHLFENFCVMEAVKAITYQQLGSKLYFWRSKQGAEIDLVIENQEQLRGIEFKWHRGHTTTTFTDRYPEATIKIISRETVY